LKFICLIYLVEFTALVTETDSLLLSFVNPFDAHCCHIDTAIKHPVPDRIKPSFVFLTSGHSDAQGWASEWPDVKNYNWRLNLVWHGMLYSCTHIAAVGVKGFKW